MNYDIFRGKDIALVSVAFNNPVVIALQIALMKKYLFDEYLLVIADNSSQPDARRGVKTVCEKADVPYVPIPRPLFRSDPSVSHGIALNWVCSNIFRDCSTKYIGFLDHDIYPFQATSIISFFNNVRAVGLEQRRGDVWYLWPGFAFFERQFFSAIPADFFPDPSQGVDTGGRLYFSHYKELDPADTVFLDESYMSMKEDDSGAAQISQCSIIGDWCHTRNASYWKECPPKEDAIIAFLSKKAGWPSLHEEVARVFS